MAINIVVIAKFQEIIKRGQRVGAYGKKNSPSCGGLMGPFGPPGEIFCTKPPTPKPQNTTFIAKMA
jgi:hypothetical protein